MRKVFGVVAVLMCVLLALGSVTVVYASGYKLFDSQLVNSATANVAYGNVIYAQTFYPNSSYNVVKLMLKCQKINVDGAFTYVNVGIVKSPNFTDLTIATVDFLVNVTVGQADLPSGGSVDYNFTFAKHPELMVNTTYAIVVMADGTNDTNCFAFQSSATSQYSGGIEVHSTNGGTSWDNATDADFYFAFYGYASMRQTVAEWIPVLFSFAIMAMCLGMLKRLSGGRR